MKTRITGTVYFANYPFSQSARIHVTPPTGPEIDTGLVVAAPAGTNKGTFEYFALELGEYTFRAEALGASQVIGGSGLATIEVVAIIAPQPTNLLLSQEYITASSTAISGTFDFGESAAPHWARVLYRSDGEVDWRDLGVLVYPDADEKGHFLISGLPAGTWEVKVVPENDDGLGTESDVETIVTTVPGPSAFIDGDSFVIAFYQGAFARDPDGTELSDELDLLAAATTGVNFYAAAVDIGDRLFHSAEYLARGRDDEEFITDLYSAYLARVPDPEGFAFWLAELGATDRDHLLEAFADSPEFRLRAFNVYGWHPEESGGGGTETKRLFQFEFDGRGSVIDPLTQPDAVLAFSPIAGTIIEAYIKDLDDIAGSCELDVRVLPRGSAPPGSIDSLVGAGTAPSTVTASESVLSDLSDWDSDHVNINDEVRAVIVENIGHEHVMFVLTVEPD